MGERAMWCERVQVQMKMLWLGLPLQVNNSAANRGRGLSATSRGVAASWEYPLISNGGFALWLACR